MNKHVMPTIFKKNNTDNCLVNVNNKWIYIINIIIVIIIIIIINLIWDIIIRANIFSSTYSQLITSIRNIHICVCVCVCVCH
jgi:hypothetical protein